MRFIPDEIVGTMSYGEFAGLLPDMSYRVRLFCWTGCKEVYANDVFVPPSSENEAVAQDLRVGERVWVLYREGNAVGLRK